MNINSDKTALKMLTASLVGLAALIVGICAGSVSIALQDTFSIIQAKLFGGTLSSSVDASLVSILWEIRIPRALCAFLIGGALAVSGAVIQAILQNPLASSYTLGVSSGACLGAAVIIITGVGSTALGYILLPLTGFLCGLFTVILVILIASRLDSGFKNHTIILFGMVFSLFVNALLTMISALNKEHMQRLVLWQMGTFSGRRFAHVAVIFGFVVAGVVLMLFRSRELDLMSFGDEEAAAVGVDTRKNKIILLVLASLLTGISVCFTGVIGFVDLVIPHIVRKIFGSTHIIVLPMCLILGGAFMTLCDLLARTLLAPQEIPIGAITALVGAPFFLWVYFKGRT
ncbi:MULTISPECIES: FecCD family ABC transporter permease [unclassified Butyrivibrio]|uniref:FecCD family ABC transporter permease n=1 Tax=unclassified Butyrivibrio TaxID=2639466 RepID=UPI000427083D|nr:MULTISPECIES: iron ABC transporter permease [unclassified Butyrivibrio]